ncbi:hypothetical protein ID866_7703 [Astraeus odoratus]|nr:hypothetical protein ID866_7703 [Astraeus odoratus]
MIEAGAEKFLREKQDILGNIPTIFVFTKYDTLTEMIEREWVDAQKTYEDETVDTEANRHLQEKCIPRIRGLTGEVNIPYIAVSTRKRFKSRLEQLIQLTQKEIQARSPQPSEQAGVDSAPALALAIAQRVAPGLKIKGSIEYVLFMDTGGPYLPALIFRDALFVIVSGVYTGNRKILLSDDFRDSIAKVVSGPQEDATPSASLSQDTTSEDVAAVVLLPFVAVGKVISWVLDTYTRIPDVQRKFMAYIVHLTHVLDVLFTLTATRTVRVYHASGKWRNVYDKIEDFAPSLFGGEHVISEVESLLWERYITDIDLERAVEKTASMLQRR